MSSPNPLNRYFRQPALYLKLPTLGKWYTPDIIELESNGEIPIFGMTAIDEILLNTPDAMLSGQALEKVIKNCVPSVRNAKQLLIPDIEAIFCGIKSANSDGMYELNKHCPSCKHENSFDINYKNLLDRISYIEDSDTQIILNDELMINVKPYTLEMRQLFIQREYEEEILLKQLDASTNISSEIERAKILAESIERISQITFNLVSKSIVSINILKENQLVTDQTFITEWLTGINKNQADIVTKTIDNLNNIGLPKTVDATCTNCGHSWTEILNFDPVSFFGKR